MQYLHFDDRAAVLLEDRYGLDAAPPYGIVVSAVYGPRGTLVVP